MVSSSAGLGWPGLASFFFLESRVIVVGGGGADAGGGAGGGGRCGDGSFSVLSRGGLNVPNTAVSHARGTSWYIVPSSDNGRCIPTVTRAEQMDVFGKKRFGKREVGAIVLYLYAVLVGSR